MSNLTAGTVFFGEEVLPSFVYTWFRLLWPNNSILVSSVHNTLSQNKFSFSRLTNLNLASLCSFNRRGVFFDLRDFRPFLSISLLIVHLVTLHPDECKSSCSSSCITIGFWLIRRSNSLDNLGEIFLGAPVVVGFFYFYFFRFSTVLRLAMNELIVVKGIFRLLEIFL